MPRSLFRVGTFILSVYPSRDERLFLKRLVRFLRQPFTLVAVFCLLSLPLVAQAAQTITINGTADYDVYGNGDSADGHDTGILGDPNGNTVIVNGTVDGAVFGSLFDGSGSITASGNTVIISGGALYAYGGSASSSGAVTASGNTVTVNGGSVIDVTAGRASGRGEGASATATNNTVNIINGNVVRDIYGGLSSSETGNIATTSVAANNSITINGGTVGGNIYGGHVFGDNIAYATNNTVTISGTPTLSGSLYGGDFDRWGTPRTMDLFTGNTLNVKNSGITVGGDVKNFQFLNFYLPSTLAAGATMLTVNGTADLTDGAGRSSTVNVGIDGSASPLKAGDSVTLIEAGTLTTNSGLNTTANGQGMQGVTLQYTFDILTDNNKLLATVSSTPTGPTGPTVNEQTKALSEGFVSGLGLVTQGADVAAGQGMASAVSAAKSSTTGGGGGMPVAGFGALSGGSVRYNSGSHVDMHSLSLLAGLALGTDITPGRLTLGAFFEYGNGSYNTYNSFSNAASVDGNGNTHYLGGGILGRMDFINTGPGRFYTEASGRAGNVYNNYESSDLRDAKGREASYDSTSAYYGLHLGTGYIWNITDEASLDLYGKYFWTRQTGDSITLSTGDPIDFDDVYSSRLRFGSRFAYAVNEYVSPYVGAAWEHEFDGKARASTNGYDMKAPSLRGDTGIGELGLTFTPSQTLPLSFDLGVQGYVGKREGVTGSLQAKYEF